MDGNQPPTTSAIAPAAGAPAAPQGLALEFAQGLAAVRAEFPILARQVHGKPLVYLDNAATTQKPQAVIDSLRGFYESHNANVHRGVHTLSGEASEMFDDAREKVRAFLNAASTDECVFVRGTTEAINLVAHSYGRSVLRPGDEVLISHMEHHSNIVPWQLLCEAVGAQLKVIPVDDAGVLDLAAYEQLLSPRTRIVAVVHVSNALGTVNPIAAMVPLAHAVGARFLCDGAQAVAHQPVDVRALDCDFYAFSGHKCFGPTGIGVLYGKRALLDAMPPYQGGGDMIETVSFEKTVFNTLPYKFEAGTPHIAGAVGLGAALDWLARFRWEDLIAHEQDLLAHALARIREVPGVRVIGTAPHKAGVLSMHMDGAHAHDVGTLLDLGGIAVRSGHHCAMPAMARFGVAATVRASFALYNTRAEVDALIDGLLKARQLLA